MNGIANRKKEILSDSLNVFGATNLLENISIDIYDDKKIEDLKNDFKAIGLIAVLYRKSGNVWVKITLTDEWSLRMQNTEGESLGV